MHLVQMPIEMLRPAPYNPRQELAPRDPRYRKLLRSIRDFGLVEPLVWNRCTGYVVGGHQRLKILRELGFKEVPVSVVDLPPDRERALNVILNNREAQSDWNLPGLTRVLEELEAAPRFDLAETGFDREMLEMLRDRMTPKIELLQPAPALEQIEVVLTLSPDRYERVRPELDALVQRHQLESHVRCR